MKKNILAMCLAFFAMTFMSEESAAQCNAEAIADRCVGNLRSGFNFIKSFQIDGNVNTKSNKVEYSYIFAKGTQYMISMCSETEDTDGILVSLYDQKRNLVSTSEVSGRKFSTIIYPCNSTGIYYLSFTYPTSQSKCGGAVLGFKR